jgi:hypothetical protein
VGDYSRVICLAVGAQGLLPDGRQFGRWVNGGSENMRWLSKSRARASATSARPDAHGLAAYDTLLSRKVRFLLASRIMSVLTECLQSFNSKERFFVVGEILGNPQFQPSPDFLEQVCKALQLPVPKPPIFCAMDYHLDWIYASLQVAGDRQDGLIYPNSEGKIKAQQEDVDFLIACDADDVCHMILIEAKGVTGWNNRQMTSKANRLREIFGEDGEGWQGVRPHFVIMSPAEPRKLNKSGWPKWMTADWTCPHF